MGQKLLSPYNILFVGEVLKLYLLTVLVLGSKKFIGWLIRETLAIKSLQSYSVLSARLLSLEKLSAFS